MSRFGSPAHATPQSAPIGDGSVDPRDDGVDARDAGDASVPNLSSCLSVFTQIAACPCGNSIEEPDPFTGTDGCQYIDCETDWPSGCMDVDGGTDCQESNCGARQDPRFCPNVCEPGYSQSCGDC